MTRLFRFLTWFFRALPERCAVPAGRLVGWLYGSVIRYHRGDALEALERSFPDATAQQRQQWLRRMYRHLGLNMVESFRSPEWSEDEKAERVRFEGLEHLVGVLEQGRGAILLSGHIGNWELMALVCKYLPKTAHIVVKDLSPPALNDLIVATREQLGVRVISRENSLRRCLKVLRDGELLAFMMDQNVIRREGWFAHFFGKEACTTPGVVQLSSKTGAPIVPLIMWRESDTRHVGRVFPPIAPPEANEAAMREKLQECNDVLESVIREDPAQWTWVHRRWRTRPVAELVAAGKPPTDGSLEAEERRLAALAEQSKSG